MSAIKEMALRRLSITFQNALFTFRTFDFFTIQKRFYKIKGLFIFHDVYASIRIRDITS